MGEPTRFYLPPWPQTEADMRELAVGRVPEWLQEIARSMVDWSLESGPVSYAGLGEQRNRQRPPTRRSTPRRRTSRLR